VNLGVGRTNELLGWKKLLAIELQYLLENSDLVAFDL
jgi:hypothetical protein